MKTFTKAEFVRACGEFYEIESELWQRRVEKWTEDGVLHTVDDKPDSGSGRARRYSEEEVYIASVLFKLKAIGFSLSTIKAVSTLLHDMWRQSRNPSDFTQETIDRARTYWNACKDDMWNEERMGGPPTLTITLVPDSGRGFGPGEAEVLLKLGGDAEALEGCEALRLNLQRIFAATRTRPPKRVTLPVSAVASLSIVQAPQGLAATGTVTGAGDDLDTARSSDKLQPIMVSG